MPRDARAYLSDILESCDARATALAGWTWTAHAPIASQAAAHLYLERLDEAALGRVRAARGPTGTR